MSPGPSTISREVRRNAATRGGNLDYRAIAAQWHADRAASDTPEHDFKGVHKTGSTPLSILAGLFGIGVTGVAMAQSLDLTGSAYVHQRPFRTKRFLCHADMGQTLRMKSRKTMPFRSRAKRARAGSIACAKVVAVGSLSASIVTATTSAF